MHGPPSASSVLFAGRYAVEREVGRGATATVLLARDTERDQSVAIKVLRADLAEVAVRQRFLRESRLTAELHHRRILPVLDAGEYMGQLYLVAPFMEGGTLRDLLVREKQLRIIDAVRIARSVADALDHAHRSGFIHRDIKPENILFHDGEAYLADFGIARALEKALGDTSTSAGIVRGTVAYMSPEQASGDHDYDGRSDIFSLGCVLYEMLAGVGAYIAATPEAVLAQRFMHPPRDIRVYRSAVPRQLEAVVSRAVAFEPADRFASAAAFAEALAAVPTDPTAAAASIRSRSVLGHHRWWERGRVRIAAGVAAVAIAVGLASAAGVRRRFGVASPATDTTHVAVLQIERPSESASRTMDDDLLHMAMARWSGIVLVDRFQVADAIRRHGPVESGDEAAAIATSLGAGRYVRGRLTREGAAWRAYAALYDVGSTRALYQATEEIPRDLTSALAAYSRLADSLLLRGAQPDTSPAGLAGRRSLPAIQAVARAQRALDEWDLAGADSAFQRALMFDSTYSGRPLLWLAQVRAWRGLSPTGWSVLAERAAARSDELSEKERQLSRALVLLGARRFEEACRVYDDLRQRNGRDFSAWFGLGQCRTMDRAVVRDSSSPSGWRFRSSYRRAVEAYITAFEILPSVHRDYERGAFERLRMLLAVSTALLPGYDIDQDSALFLARPAWLDDTLALVPYPWQAVFAGNANVVPPGFTVALEAQRTAFRRIAAGWSAAFPRSAGAKHAVAIALELMNDPTAIDTVRAARQLADSAQRLRLGAAEVLMLVRFGAPDNEEYLRAAAALSDSLLAGVVSPTGVNYEDFASVAALAGRCSTSETLARRPDPASAAALRIAPRLYADGLTLSARVALGCRPTAGSITIGELARSIERAYGPDERRRISEVLLFRPAMMADVPDSSIVVSLAAHSQHGLLQAASARARRDPAGVRSALAAFASEWRPELGPPTPDIAYPGARLWMAIGDTAQAIDWLERSLGGLPTSDPRMLTDQARAAALVRAMVLRADFANAARDPNAARRWGTAVTLLWGRADSDLRPIVDRMARYGARR